MESPRFFGKMLGKLEEHLAENLRKDGGKSDPYANHGAGI